MKNTELNNPLSLKKMKITDSFWKREMELVRKEVIPYQWEALNDRVKDAVPSYCMRNFRVAGKMNREKHRLGKAYKEPEYTFRGFEALPEDPKHLEDKFYGCVFQDSDFSKWIEAVAYSLEQYPDEVLEKIADDAIDVVCEAQQDDGYLDTYYIINGKDKIFTNLKDHHELYCFGHLTEGAVAYYQATGKDKLLKAAERFADYIADYFGEKEGKCKGYPGHEIAEMALIRLYETTGEDKYLRLSQFFINQRGTRPYYFDIEQGVKLSDKERESQRYQYYQAHLPVREQKEAVGHAVRAVYLYSGMADIARHSGDNSLYQACETLWDNIVDQKMYLTGGIGSTHIGEAFSFAYDLPNDTAYAETCASIGLVFFARRMLQIAPKVKYADVMERALYNGVLSGMALDGKSFFYVNPLEVNPESCHKDERKFHVKPVRQKWFGCACCPPNLARMLSSIGTYAYTENENTLYVHLYMGSVVEKEINGHKAEVRIESDFPWNGRVSVSVNTEDNDFVLALRIPGWCDHYKFSGACEKTYVKDGYLYICGFERQESRSFILDFPMEPIWIMADSHVREDIGKVALQRGPIVYCMEEKDNGKDLHQIAVDPEKTPTPFEMMILDEKIISLKAQGIREILNVSENNHSLYSRYYKRQNETTELTYIPYYTWANRGENEMQVWTREGK